MTDEELMEKIRAALALPNVLPTLDSCIGRHRLIRHVGEGSFAWVWEAFDTEHRKATAIKIFRRDNFPEGTTREKAARRFFQGGVAMSSLGNSPYIATIVDGPEIEGPHIWFAMDYFEGKDLSLAIRDRSLTEEELSNIAEQVLGGIRRAHQHDIIHRDVKPHNILLDKSTTPVRALLTDFDIAYYEHLFTTHGSTTLMSMGVTRYIPTDVMLAHAGDIPKLMRRKSNDLYAFCVVLLEMFAGLGVRIPPGGRPQTVLALLPPPKAKEPGEPTLSQSTRLRVAAVCAKGLAADETARYDTVQSLHEAWTKPRSSPLVARLSAGAFLLASVTTVCVLLDAHYHGNSRPNWTRTIVDSGFVGIGTSGLTLSAVVAVSAKKLAGAFDAFEAWLATFAIRRLVAIILAATLPFGVARATGLHGRIDQHRVTQIENGTCRKSSGKPGDVRVDQLLSATTEEVVCETRTAFKTEGLSWMSHALGVAYTTKPESERQLAAAQAAAAQAQIDAVKKDAEIKELNALVATLKDAKAVEADARQKLAAAEKGATTTHSAVHPSSSEVALLRKKLLEAEADRRAAEAAAERSKRATMTSGVTNLSRRCSTKLISHPPGDLDVVAVNRLDQLCSTGTGSRVTYGAYVAECTCY